MCVCVCLRVCKITTRNSRNDPKKPSLKTTHTQWNLYYVCFVLFNSRPPVWGLTDQWNRSWTRARHSQEWDQKVLTHTFLSLRRGALYLSYLQPSWNHLSAELSSTEHWTGAGSTLMKVVVGSPCGTWCCRSDNIYSTRDYTSITRPLLGQKPLNTCNGPTVGGQAFLLSTKPFLIPSKIKKKNTFLSCVPALIVNTTLSIKYFDWLTLYSVAYS